MPDSKYKLFAERILLYNITSEPTESPTPLPFLSQTPTSTPVAISDCNIKIYVLISAATSIFTTLCVVFAGYYLVRIRQRCKVDCIGFTTSIGVFKRCDGASNENVESSSSHAIDVEPMNSDEIFWFEDVYVDT